MSRRQIDPVSHFFLPFSFHALYHYLCFFPVLTNGPLAQLRGVFWEELLKPLWGVGWRSSAWEVQTCSKTRAGPAFNGANEHFGAGTYQAFWKTPKKSCFWCFKVSFDTLKKTMILFDHFCWKKSPKISFKLTLKSSCGWFFFYQFLINDFDRIIK